MSSKALREKMMAKPGRMQRWGLLLIVLGLLGAMAVGCSSSGPPGTESNAAGSNSSADAPSNTISDTYARIVATIKAGNYARAERELQGMAMPYAEPDSMAYGCRYYLAFKRGQMREAHQLSLAAVHTDPEFSTLFLEDTDATNMYAGSLLNDYSHEPGQPASTSSRLAVRETERMLAAYPSVEAKSLNIAARARVIQLDRTPDSYPALLAEAKALAQQYPQLAMLNNQVAELTREVDGPAAAVTWRDAALAGLPPGDSTVACSVLYEKGTDLMLSGQFRAAIDNYHELLRRAGAEDGASNRGQPAPQIEYVVRSSWLGLARAHGMLGEIVECITYLKRTEYRGVNGGNTIRQDMYLKKLAGNTTFQRFLNEYYGRGPQP